MFTGLCVRHQKIFVRHLSGRVNDVVIASAVRTPIAGVQSYLASLTATQLGASVIEAAVKQSAIPKEQVQEVYMGNVLSAGVGQAPARQSAIFAELPKTVCCTTVNNVGASGMKAIILATQTLQLGNSDVAIAGGMESMSNVPYYMPRTSQVYGGLQLQDGIICDGLPDTSVYADKLVKKLSISPQMAIDYAKSSYTRSTKAWSAGVFDAEIVPIRIQQKHRPEVLLTEDEEYKRADFSKFAQLSSKDHKSIESYFNLSDGAAALVLTTVAVVERYNLKPLARILAYQEANTDPTDYSIAPISLAVSRLLESTGIHKNDIAMWEIDEALPVIPLAFANELEIDINQVNVHGGAIFHGYPIGMAGAHLVCHLAHTLKTDQLGCAAICDGSGGASAILIQRMDNPTPATWNLPILTLYTKEPCPLCDALVEELEANFSGQYHLEKVFITEKENVRFLRLFRYDIPVLFLNGQFLCMHKLNVNLLLQKLMQIKG